MLQTSSDGVLQESRYALLPLAINKRFAMDDR